MEIRIEITKKHIYLMTILAALILGGVAVVAFGGSSPSVMGHSALELIVNSSSVVDNSLGAADIDSTSLATECSTITGGAGLCDGSDADTIGISSCTIYTGTTATNTCSASCGSERLMGGGCRCGGGTTAIFESDITGIGAGGFSGTWGCVCAGGTVACQAQVECCI